MLKTYANRHVRDYIGTSAHGPPANWSANPRMIIKLDFPISVRPSVPSLLPKWRNSALRQALSAIEMPMALIALSLLIAISTVVESRADDGQTDQSGSVSLKQLSLEQLGDVEIT